ncbi:MAG: dienelactone hydrolase family protein [Saprospirales bacterium]|nr:dienelactone hydrolase family protein [Saprospirales bacterium]
MCHDSNAAFAAFSNDPDFRAAHPAPKPVEVVHGGVDVTFPVASGENGRGFLVKSHAATDMYLFLFHEWWGLNNYIRNEAAMWSHELGINVLAVDLYDGKVAATADEAGQLMRACDPARAAAIIRGAATFAGDKADFRTMGWCFGGGWSLQAALALGERAKACVIYYGMPEKDVERLKSLSTDVLMIHAKKDQWINDEVVRGFKEKMEEAGKTLIIREYDADHAFANPSSPRYNEPAAKASREQVKKYLSGESGK